MKGRSSTCQSESQTRHEASEKQKTMLHQMVRCWLTTVSQRKEYSAEVGSRRR